MGMTLIGHIYQATDPTDPNRGVNQEALNTAIGVHVNSSAPHPAYDENLNLLIYFENGLA